MGLFIRDIQLDKKLNKTNPDIIQGSKPLKIALNLVISLSILGLANPSSSSANTVYALGVGFRVDATTLDAINAATTFYNLAGTDHGANLPSSLGATININQGGSLLLSGATAKTWQSSTDSANSVTLF